MKFTSSSDAIKDYQGSDIAKSERYDCAVRAIAGLLDVKYDDAHAFVADVFQREHRKGTIDMHKTCSALAKAGTTHTIDESRFKFRELKPEEVVNFYKVKDTVVSRKKTVKSFVQSHEIGMYLVFVSGHVFAVNNGTIIDNQSDEYKPTRRVIAAVGVNVVDDQLVFSW